MKNIKKGTFIRTVLQILVYINQLIAVIGSTSFASSPIYQWVSVIVTILITALTYWYDNDWTKEAQLCSDVFDMLKDGKITKEELQEFMNKYRNKKE